MDNSFKPSPWLLTVLGVVALLSSVIYGLSVYLKSKESVNVPPSPAGQIPGVVYTPQIPRDGEALVVNDPPISVRRNASGEVRWVNFASRKLILLDGSDRYEVTVAGNAKIKKGTHPSTFDELREGDIVYVTASVPFSGLTFVADSLTIEEHPVVPSAPTDPDSILE